MIRFRLSSRGEAVAIQDKIVLYLKSIWIASLPLAMTVKGNLDCFATARNDFWSSRVSETNVAIQDKIVLYLKFIWIASLSLAMTVKGT